SFVPDTSTPVISPLSLHDALPISRLRQLAIGVGSEIPCRRRYRPRHRSLRGRRAVARQGDRSAACPSRVTGQRGGRSEIGRRRLDRKSTRLNSSHVKISYAVFCLK